MVFTAPVILGANAQHASAKPALDIFYSIVNPRKLCSFVETKNLLLKLTILYGQHRLILQEK